MSALGILAAFFLGAAFMAFVGLILLSPGASQWHLPMFMSREQRAMQQRADQRLREIAQRAGYRTDSNKE